MMRIIALTIGAMVLISIMPIVNAQTIYDYTNDVLYCYYDGLNLFIEIDDRPNVDITKVSYEIEGNILTLQMWVEGEIIIENSTTYGIYFGEYLFGFCNNEVSNSSSYLNYGIDTNLIFCTFQLIENENITKYNLTASAIEYIGNIEEDYELWIDVVPDVIPPFIFIKMGAGKNYGFLGRGIFIEIENMHDSESVDCSFDINFNATYREKNSNITSDFIVNPNSIWKYSLRWKVIPIFCDVELMVTISNVTYSLSGHSIGNWYFFDTYEYEINNSVIQSITQNLPIDFFPIGFIR
jgi:hypothetical protein